MKILITGATGLIGRQVGKSLFEKGHDLVIVSRSRSKALSSVPFPCEVLECDLMKTALPRDAFAGIVAIIHLLGESVDGRWTEPKKKLITESRTLSTQHLLQNLPPSVKTIIQASAQGIYGDRNEEELNETSNAGAGFLAEVCRLWEKPLQEKMKAVQGQTSAPRIVVVRIGMVLTFQGGALRKLVSLFQKNLGATLGSGRQWISWISLKDLVQIFVEAVENPALKGVVNAVQPDGVRNQEFTRTLQKVLGCGLLPPVPRLVLKAVLGEMSELVLASQKVAPHALKEIGFRWTNTDLESFLSEELKDFTNGQSLYFAEQFIAAPIEKVFDFFSAAENLEKITPPILQFRIRKISTANVQQGTLILYRLKIHGFPARWLTLIETWRPPVQFVDTQLKGPYRKWHHTHTFAQVGSGTLMTDHVRYRVPLGLLGRAVAGAFVEADIGRIFSFRRQIIAEEKF